MCERVRRREHLSLQRLPTAASRVLVVLALWRIYVMYCYVHRTITATCFGILSAPTRFVAVEHSDPNYVYFFGELLLCFTAVHEGMAHELCFIEYVWPGKHLQINSCAEDGVPLVTEYVRTPKKLYAVRPVEQVLFCPQLVVPPTFGAPPPNARAVYVLNDDIYGNF